MFDTSPPVVFTVYCAFIDKGINTKRNIKVRNNCLCVMEWVFYGYLMMNMFVVFHAAADKNFEYIVLLICVSCTL